MARSPTIPCLVKACYKPLALELQPPRPSQPFGPVMLMHSPPSQQPPTWNSNAFSSVRLSTTGARGDGGSQPSGSVGFKHSRANRGVYDETFDERSNPGLKMQRKQNTY